MQAKIDSKIKDTEVVWTVLETVTDPEIPVISIRELGVLRDVYWQHSTLVVVITPTYSGCPAMREIRADILSALHRAGYEDVLVEMQLAPAWTTDWISDEGGAKLQAYGIAPPSRQGKVLCPQCQSENTSVISEFGSTACKALYRCNTCLEPFDYFKCI